jgi:DNA repair protein RecN (Recombination protein N)
MLQHLTIKNFALIEHYEISFESGMTVLTGETGAGKSILIDALSLALGSRADSKMIRAGQERCDITAEFNIDQLNHVQSWLKGHDLAEDQTCLLRRTINSDGKSRAFINGQPVTLQQLNELGESLIDIHGQHEHHFLLKRDHQLLLLDEFAQNNVLLQEIRSLYDQWQTLEKQKSHFDQLQQNNSQKEFLNFQYQELKELALQAHEVETLEAEFKTLNQAEDILQRCHESLTLLAEGDVSITSILGQAQQLLGSLESIDPHLSNANKNLAQADVLIHEAVLDLRHYLSHFNASPDRLEEISSRLDHIHRIARKHRVKPEALMGVLQTLEIKLKELAHADEHLAQLEKAQQALLDQYQALAKQLSKQRLQAAKRLAAAVTKEMQRLAMTGGEFEIRFQPRDESIHSNGAERCEFWVRPNPGQSAQPLAKTASGGELSRISLALQVILAAHTVVPTLIFDEVDVGIGGATASIVGQLLKQLGEHVQVLCVTHLPQVAAFGDHHYQVQKMVVDQQTIASLKKLNAKSRQEEIARMLGGVSITPQSLAHAKEMLAQAK